MCAEKRETKGSSQRDRNRKVAPSKKDKSKTNPADPIVECIMADIMDSVAKRQRFTIKIDYHPPAPKKVDNFKLVTSSLFNGCFPVNLYVSLRTGLVVVIGEMRGPMVSTTICFATESFDDDGLPEALRNLVFLGSEDYPYRGVVKTLAQNCHVTSIDSWTEVNHTCYSFTSVTEGGFLNMLPVFMDHLFYPTLKKTNYITDVFHINEHGMDGGKVVNQLKRIENSRDEILRRHMMNLVYNDTNYSFSPYGKIENFRSTTTNEKIRRFHKQYYRPENCFVIVAGSTSKEVLNCVNAFEKKIVSKGPRGYYHRPWQSAIPPLRLEDTLVSSVKYPSEDVSKGQVIMAWRGPNVVRDYSKIIACDFMLRYLTDENDGCLIKEFVNLKDPYASKITYQVGFYIDSLLAITFHDVPVSKMGQIKDKLIETFKNCVRYQDIFLGDKMSPTFKNIKLDTIKGLEYNDNDLFTVPIIHYQLYGKNVDDFERGVQFLHELNDIEKLPPKFWGILLSKYFIRKKGVCVLGTPSAEELQYAANNNALIINERVKKYGKDGLNRFKKNVSSARADNNVKYLLWIFGERGILISSPNNRFRIKIEKFITLDKIKIKIKIRLGESTPTYEEPIPVTLIENLNIIRKPTNYIQFNLYDTELKKHKKFDFDKVPVNMQITDLFSSYITIYGLIDTEKLVTEFRPYLPLLVESMVDSGINRNGESIEYDEVLNERKEDLIYIKGSVGIKPNEVFSCGLPSQIVCICIKVDFAKYTKGILWMRDTLFNSVFTEERLNISIEKLIDKNKEIRENQKAMVVQIMNGITHNNNTNYKGTNACFQLQFLKNTKECMDVNSMTVLRRMHNAREHLVTHGIFRIHMVVNMEMLSSNYPDAAILWQNILPDDIRFNKYLKAPNPELSLFKSRLSDSCIVCEGEDGYICLCSPSCSDFMDKDLPALFVCLEYLSNRDSALYNSLLELGGVLDIIPCVAHGKIYFTINHVQNVTEALNILQEKLKEHTDSEFVWDENLIKSAVNSVIIKHIAPESDVHEVSLESVLGYYYNRVADFKKKLCDNIYDVTPEDMALVAEKYLTVVFNFSLTKAAIICSESAVESVLKQFYEWGSIVKPYQTYEECFKKLF